MANLSITVLDVKRVSGNFEVVTAGETIVQGQVLYLDTSDSKYNLTINSSEATTKAAGIALCAGGDGQPIIIQTDGDITIGATVVVGEIYLVSGAPGAIAPEEDVTVTKFVTVLGVGISTTVIRLNIDPYPVAIP